MWAWIVVAVALVGGGIAFAASRSGDDEASPTITDITDDTDAPDETDESPDSTLDTLAPETVPDTAPDSVPDSAPITLPTVPETVAPTSPPGLPYDLAITEQWFYVSGDNIWDYGGIVENRGTQTATGFIEIEIDFYDAADRIIDTESAFVDTVIPGQRTPFVATLYEPAAPPTRMEVRLADDNYIDEAPGPVGGFTFANITTADDGFTFDVLGEATSTFTVDLEFVQLVAIWREADGTVIWTSYQYLDRVPAGSTTAFTISSYSELAPRVCSDRDPVHRLIRSRRWARAHLPTPMPD